jgi:cytochrome c oxidase cbb3-type subunit 3
MAVICIGILSVFAALHVRNTRAVRARLLMADPDAIARDAQLMRYALPLGRKAFGEHCAGCHRDDLRGDRLAGVPDLVDGDWLYGSGRVGEIERIVLYGIRAGHSKTQKLADMPAFAAVNPYARYKIEPLSPRDIDDVTALIYSFQHPQAVDAASVSRGDAVFHGKGLCFDCHSEHAKGDPAIGAPNLTDDIWLYGDGSMQRIRQEIAGGLAGVCPQWVSRLSPETIRALAVYVHSRREKRS